MRKLLLLRPEPGLSVSAERARKLGLEVIPCPLFEVEPVDWVAPDAADYDALLLTSANAVRHAGPGVNSLKGLPVHAVGPATAEAARYAGFRVESVGSAGAAELLDELPASLHLLHLAGENVVETADPRIDRQIVYRSVRISEPQLPPLEGLVAAIHSPRAGARLAEISETRHHTAIAAISAAAAAACGDGWERLEIADQSNDDSLLALAASLCHTSPQ